MRAIITKGISCSGKSTWAEEYCKTHENWVEINRDNIRWKLFTHGVPDWTKYRFTKDKERRVNAAQDEMIEDAARFERNIIISDTNLKEGRLKAFVERLEAWGFDTEVKEFDISVEKAWKRDAHRYNGVGHSTIWRQFKQKSNESVLLDKSLPHTIICDIDGTIADMTGVRHPFEFDKCGGDKPKQHVIDIIESLYYNHTGSLFFFSGREDSCLIETRNWLEEHVEIPPEDYKLFMRRTNDTRPDTVIKREFYDAHIHGKYYPHSVFDDRPCMIRMWTLMGVNMVAVGDPYIEF